MTVLERAGDNIAGLSLGLLMDAQVPRARERMLLSDPVEASLDLSDRQLLLTIGRPEAGWLYPVLARIQELDRLREDWDSYGGRPISGAVLEQTLRVLAATMEDDTPTPWIVPTSDGGVQLEWHDEPRSFEVSIASNLAVSAYFTDGAADEEVVEEDLPPSRASVLRDLLARTVDAQV